LKYRIAQFYAILFSTLGERFASMKFVVVVLLAFVASAMSSWDPAMENPGLMEGDIMETPEQKLMRNAFGSIKYRRWTNGVIPYVINSNIGNSQFIKDSFADYQAKTCLRFVQRTTQRNYVEFYNGKGCNSYVGMIGNKQIINLGPGCHSKSTAIHEIGHALGLVHEQNRPDRDQYVTIHLNNLYSKQWAYAFSKKSTRYVDSLGTPYDFYSVMHYQSTAFARSGKKTIIVKPQYQKFQTIIDNNYHFGLSTIDVQQVNLMYRCSNSGGTKDVKNKGAQCWGPCSTGKCSFCGNDGYCCRAGWSDSTSYQCNGALAACNGFHCCTGKA